MIINIDCYFCIGMYLMTDQRIEVHGDAGMLQAENKHPTSVVLSNREGTHFDTIK
jgi:hypothetical protein